MNKSFAVLRQKVLSAVREQTVSASNPDRHRQQVLSEFMRLCLAELNISEQQLAERIDLPVEAVQGFLDNTLPVPDDERLQQIAAVLGYEPGLFRVILKGSPVTRFT